MDNSQFFLRNFFSGMRVAAVVTLLATAMFFVPFGTAKAFGINSSYGTARSFGTLQSERDMHGADVGYQSSLADINRERERFERRAMSTLLGWGTANVAAGSALLLTDWSDAGLMTLSWGAINAGIAFFAIRGQERLDPHNPRLADFLKREQQFQRIVAVNAGLNVSYITAGLLMQHYGNKSRTRQFGSAVAIQGAFLLAFDSYLLYRSTRYLGRVTPLLDSASFEGNSAYVLPGVRVSW